MPATNFQLCMRASIPIFGVSMAGLLQTAARSNLGTWQVLNLTCGNFGKSGSNPPKQPPTIFPDFYWKFALKYIWINPQYELIGKKVALPIEFLPSPAFDKTALVYEGQFCLFSICAAFFRHCLQQWKSRMNTRTIRFSTIRPNDCLCVYCLCLSSSFLSLASSSVSGLCVSAAGHFSTSRLFGLFDCNEMHTHTHSNLLLQTRHFSALTKYMWQYCDKIGQRWTLFTPTIAVAVQTGKLVFLSVQTRFEPNNIERVCMQYQSSSFCLCLCCGCVPVCAFNANIWFVFRLNAFTLYRPVVRETVNDVRWTISFRFCLSSILISLQLERD